LEELAQVSRKAKEGILGDLFIVGETIVALEQKAYLFQLRKARREGPQGQAKGTEASFERRLVEEPPLEKGFEVRQVERPECILRGLGARR